MKLKDVRIEWTPAGHEPPRKPGVLVYHSNAPIRSGRRYAYFLKQDYSQLSPLRARLQMMIDFHKIVVRDGLNPGEVHREFLKIEEFRRIVAPDCVGADR